MAQEGPLMAPDSSNMAFKIITETKEQMFLEIRHLPPPCDKLLPATTCLAACCRIAAFLAAFRQESPVLTAP